MVTLRSWSGSCCRSDLLGKSRADSRAGSLILVYFMCFATLSCLHIPCGRVALFVCSLGTLKGLTLLKTAWSNRRIHAQLLRMFLGLMYMYITVYIYLFLLIFAYILRREAVLLLWTFFCGSIRPHGTTFEYSHRILHSASVQSQAQCTLAIGSLAGLTLSPRSPGTIRWSLKHYTLEVEPPFIK